MGKLLYARTDCEAHTRKQPLKEHLENVGHICQDFCYKYPTIAYLLGYIHDLGKACDAFQTRLLTGAGKVDHSSAGAVYLQKLAEEIEKSVSIDKNLDDNSENEMLSTSEVLDICAFAAMCHHSGLRNMYDGDEDILLKTRLKPENESKYSIQYDQTKANGQLYCQAIDDIVKSKEFVKECCDFKDNLCAFLRAHNLSIMEYKFFGGLYIRYMYSCLIDADRTDAYLFDKNKEYVPRARIEKQTFENFEKIKQSLDDYIKNCASSPLKEVRDEIYNSCIEKAKENSNVFELNVQTGGGKTFSSFRFALERILQGRAKKIIYVVPYLSIIEQNANAIHNILKKENLQDMIVESHSNAVNINETPESDETKTTKFESAFTSWNEPIIFTTMVSFLESVYCGKTQNNRRFHNMEDAVIIFDEIQTLPINCIALFNGLVNFLAGYLNSTIVLCTATQPTLSNLEKFRTGKLQQESARLNLLSPTPIIDKKFTLLDRTEIIIENDTLDLNSASEFVMQKFIGNGNVLFVVNTKKCALQIYNNIKITCAAKCYHLSTNMCPQHRLDTIEEIKENLAENISTIVISTQLIEAGVDLDFPCVIRSRAGLESVIQSAGRCNREGKLRDASGNPQKGKVYVVTLDENLENISNLSDIFNRRSKFNEICHLNEDVMSDKAIERYFNNVYGIKSLNDLKFPIDKIESAYDLLSYHTLPATLKETPYNVTPERNINKFVGYQFQTVASNFHVINQDTIGVLVPYGKGKEYITKFCDGIVKFDKEMQRYMVNIYKNKLPLSLQQANGILYYEGEYYDDVGLSTELVEKEFEGGVIY